MQTSKSFPQDQAAPSAKQTSSCCCRKVETAEPAAEALRGTDKPAPEPARRASGCGCGTR